jgi:hypothetical protein
MTEPASIFDRPEVRAVSPFLSRTALEGLNIDETWQMVRAAGYEITRATWREAVREQQTVFYRGEEIQNLPSYLTVPERLWTEKADYTEKYAVKFGVVGVLTDGTETDTFGVTLEYAASPTLDVMQAELESVMLECPEMPAYTRLRVVSAEYWRKSKRPA